MPPGRDSNGKKEITADLLLLHAPSVFDFRERDDLLFAYLSDSDSVNVTSIFEMFPIGLTGSRLMITVPPRAEAPRG